MDQVVFCQSCGMPLESDDVKGTEKDGSKSECYCSYCYQNGGFTQDITMDEMIEDVYKRQVGDNAFIGCNTNLISPVRVGNDVYIAAGSTITDDIPEGAFAIARSRQTVKNGWKDKRK